MLSTIQCVPNFSEGRNADTIQAIVNAAGIASGADVIDWSADPDHNRMVVTLLGDPSQVRRSIASAAWTAVKLIDLNKHFGVHPRIGAVDVAPLVPIRGISMDECVELSRLIGADIAALGVPVYFYERSALKRERTKLADIRRGGFERLKSVELVGDLAPDLGPDRVHPTAGACVVGARGPLVAFNINLNTQDLDAARSIARRLRSGDAGLEGVKAIGVKLESRGIVQVSMNVTRPDLVSLKDIYLFVEAEAGSMGMEVVESELIGAIERRFVDFTPPDLKLPGPIDSRIIRA